jgi:hypothetical protein
MNDKVDELITKLEFMPLALTQAVTLMSNNFMKPTRFLELHDENETARAELLAGDCQDVGQEISQTSVATIWVVSFNQIKEKHPKAADLLAFMSFLDRQDIPKDLLPRGEISSVQFDFALGTLRSYAMITESSTKQDSIYMI